MCQKFEFCFAANGPIKQCTQRHSAALNSSSGDTYYPMFFGPCGSQLMINNLRNLGLDDPNIQEEISQNPKFLYFYYIRALHKFQGKCGTSKYCSIWMKFWL